MKIITVKELHDRTGRLVRAAGTETLVITDRGEKIAVLKKYSEFELETAEFPKRNSNSLPKIDGDSTSLISRDREE